MDETDLRTATSGPGDRIVRLELSWGSAVRAVVVVVAAMVAIGVVRQLRPLLTLVAFSLFLALAIEPLVRRIRARTEWSRGAAVGVVYVGAVLLVMFLVAIVLPATVRLADIVADQAGDWFASLNDWSGEQLGFPLTGGDLAAQTGDAASVVARFGQRALGLAAAGASLVFTLATVALFTFYLSADMPRVQRAVLGMFRPAAQERVVWIWDQAIEQTGAYFYTRLVLMGVNAVGFFATLVIVGVPTRISLAMSVFAGFVSVFIPAVGTYIGSALPILIALALQGLGSALVVLGYAVVYQQIENYVLVPRLSADTMSLNGGIAFGAVIAGGALAGALGAFVALPVAALLVALVTNYGRSHEVVSTSTFDDSAAEPTEPTEPAEVRER